MTIEIGFSIHIPESDKKRVVIIGGGFGGMEFAKLLNDEDIQLVMIDRHNYHTFQPLLYQVATAGLEPDSIASPLRQMFNNKKKFYFRMAIVNEVIPEENAILTSIGKLKYDLLVIAVGSKTNYFGNEALIKKCFPLKQVPHALDLRSNILQNFEKAVLTRNPKDLDGLMDYVVVGGGPTGVELAGAIAELKNHVLPKDYPELDFTKMDIYLIEGTSKLLGGMSEVSSTKAYDFLRELGVKIIVNSIVTSYDGENVFFKDGSFIRTKTLIWAAGVKGNVIPGLKEECLFKGHRIKVDEFNKATGYENIYAIGDIAAMITPETPQGYPMVAPVAMQQGRQLARNVNLMLKGKPMKPFKYKDKGTMATIGRNKAVVEMPGGIRFQGIFAWFVWMFVHLLFLIGFRSKLVVLLNWLWSYFTFDKGTRLIIRPYVQPNNPLPTDSSIKSPTVATGIDNAVQG